MECASKLNSNWDLSALIVCTLKSKRGYTRLMTNCQWSFLDKLIEINLKVLLLKS